MAFHSHAQMTLMAGPCSVETKAQVFETARQLKEIPELTHFRAGVWKPRTSPKSFEGLGEKALPWLEEIQKEFQLPVAIEVAHPKHIELALKYGITHLWLGARTTVSPFSVQEISEALKGTEANIFIKNPINPDIKLWAGAVERIEKAGIKNIALIHRGFSAFHEELRYPPLWHLALEMMDKHQELPFLCDPSHICGSRKTLKEVAQASLNFGASGLMLESHRDPSKAWSDSEQQLTPQDLKILLKQLSSPSLGPLLEETKALELEQINREIEKLQDRRSELLREKEKRSLGFASG